MNNIVESENVCNMPEKATIILHQSNETGLYYIEVINYDDHIRAAKGCWKTKAITEERLLKLAGVINSVLRVGEFV